MKSLRLAARIWFLTGIIFGSGWMLYTLFDDTMPAWSAVIATLCALIGSLPVLVSLAICLPIINIKQVPRQQKKLYLILTCLFFCFLYGSAASLILYPAFKYNFFVTIGISVTILLACSLVAIAISSYSLSNYFTHTNRFIINKYKNMETQNYSSEDQETFKPAQSNKILYKGIITGVLILIMLIPTIFINNLVAERQARQAQVASEVGDRWAQSQTLTGPYIYLPYKTVIVDTNKKTIEQLNHLFIIPDNLDVTGSVSHELRQRSIYKVLLYSAALNNTGDFVFQIPKEIDSSMVQWQNAKICYGISDFKGIEERLLISFNGAGYELSPGLPSDDIDEKGLSVSIPLSAEDIGKKINFNMNIKIKGSEQLHFIPLSGDSRFTLRSTWANPSFDGSDLPSVRTVNHSGFTAMWSFNKANLPFGTVLNNFKYDHKDLAFGVTMIQPADGYAKTNRCIKYAILFIGLTFSLFFIIELLQKKPVHPVQYILIGMALIIFYTLLLSISEFIPFDFSYFIAATATVLLITFYAYGHFRSSRTAAIFGSVLILLYGFTFVLIRLEDTALLIGSIGLFIILAIAMYLSRKINWYGQQTASLYVNNVS